MNHTAGVLAALSFAAAATIAVVDQAPSPRVTWSATILTESGYTHTLTDPDAERTSLLRCMRTLARYGRPTGLAASWCEVAQ